MDAGLLGMANSVPTAVNIAKICPCQPADNSVLGISGNFPDGFKVSLRGNWKAGLDNINPHLVQQVCDFPLFFVAHGRARALFAVAQGCVEDNDAVCGLFQYHDVSLSMSQSTWRDRCIL